MTVQGNFFGVGADNTTIAGNRLDGVLVDGSSVNTQVGGVIPLGNVSAGNGLNGIAVLGTARKFVTFNTFGGGKPVVHHAPKYRIMTNDPPYDEQLRLLSELDFSHPSCDMPLPGNVNARDRFQRASYFAALLPAPRDEREAAAGVMAIARNTSVPFGAPYGDFGVYDTEYRTVCDLTNRRCYFELTTAPNVIWTELDKLGFKPGAPVMTLDPADIRLAGEVSGAFRAGQAPY